MLLYELLELGRVMFAGKRVRVVSVGQEAHFNVHAFFQQHVDPPDRSLDTGCIPVVQYGHVVGEAVNQTDLPRCQRSARRGHHIFYTGLVHGYDVRIAFHQEATVLLHNSLLGEIDTVQFVAFMIDCRFGRVDILHLDSFCGTGKYTAAESHHFTR